MEENKKVSVVGMDHAGRIHFVDGAQHNIHHLYVDHAYAGDDDAASAVEDADEMAYDAGLKAFEERWLRDRGVTHIIDHEDFGDEQEHALAEFLSL